MNQFFIGTIVPMAFNFAPTGYMSCEGQLLPIAQYQAVFALLGTTYGGNGQTTFALPDLRGRRVIGQGVSPTLGTWTEGQAGGVEQTTILLSQLPNHTHQVVVKTNGAAADSTDPTNNYFGNDSAQTAYDASNDNTFMNPGAITAGTAGSSLPVNIQAPYLAMYYNICIYGLFPSRN